MQTLYERRFTCRDKHALMKTENTNTDSSDSLWCSLCTIQVSHWFKPSHDTEDLSGCFRKCWSIKFDFCLDKNDLWRHRSKSFEDDEKETVTEMITHDNQSMQNGIFFFTYWTLKQMMYSQLQEAQQSSKKRKKRGRKTI